jgi:phosphoglycolate phosphatase-like HAD superfamily hydrolase
VLEAVLFDWEDTLMQREDGARRLGSTTHALLDSLRERGLKVVVGVDSVDDLSELGIADRLDAVAASPDEALERIGGVAAADTLFVGAYVQDIRAAAARGMTTVQALWFHADGDAAAAGGEADYQAFTQMDVLNVVRRLLNEQ